MKGASLIAPLGVRMPDELKEKIQAQAKENGRSTNAEIVQILENSFTQHSDGDTNNLMELVRHHERMLEMKDEIIATQSRSISQMEGTIASLNEHVNFLKDHVELLKKQYK